MVENIVDNKGQNRNLLFGKKKEEWVKIGFLVSMFIVPVLNFIIFYVYVNIDGILLSFQKPDKSFTLDNFKWVFNEFKSENSIMKEALTNTLIFFFNGYIVCRAITLLLAYFFYKKILGYKFFRVFYYIPDILSSVVMVAVFEGFIGPCGPVYQLLYQWTGVQYEFLFDSRYAMGTMLFYQVWLCFGTGTIMLSSSMARIPQEVMESALLDGANTWQELIYMIMPLIWPTLSTMMITGLAGIFGASGGVLLFTQGKFGTYTISYWMYEQVNVYKSLHKASALGQVYTLIAIPIVFGGRYIIERFIENVEY